MDWDVRRRRVRRGGEAPRRDAQDPRAARAADQRDAACACRCSSATRRRSGSRRRSRSRPSSARELLAAAPGVRLDGLPDARRTPPADGRRARRPHPPRPGGRERPRLFVACDNLRKGAALNAIQIAELLLAQQPRRGLIGRIRRAFKSHGEIPILRNAAGTLDHTFFEKSLARTWARCCCARASSRRAARPG